GTTAFSLTEIKSPPAGGRFDLFLNLGQVEGACRLARRIILHGSEELSRQLLDGDENEHTLQEPIVVGVRVVLRFLERIAAQIEQQRHPQLNEWLAPHAELLATVFEEDNLPVLIPGGDDLAVVIDVPELLA